MKNIHKHEEHTPRKLIQIKSSNNQSINHRSIKIQPEFSQGAIDTERDTERDFEIDTLLTWQQNIAGTITSRTTISFYFPN